MIAVQDLHKNYNSGKVVVRALRGLSFDVGAGEFASIVGPSGCGKSTLLYVLGGMLPASHGTVRVDGFDVTAAGDRALTRFRREQIGFVFQRFNLIGSLNVYDNLKLACDIKGGGNAADGRIESVLERVGLAHKSRMKPLALSQGEQQRVAIARALVRQPKLLLADEPTGNLDSENAEKIVTIFKELSQSRKQTVLMITHNRTLAAATRRIIEMKDGRVVASGREERSASMQGSAS
jgi:putative ABC transport system ATP-binding protein